MPGNPTSLQERFVSLDVLRGFAVCGLAPMNAMDFAFETDHYFSPGQIEGFPLVIWHGLMILGSGKFMALFALLFGAGLVLAAQRREEQGLPVTGFTLKRLAWLWFFGCLHAYLIWYGDILVTYAVTGAVVFWCRRWKPRTQTIVGLGMLGMFPLLMTIGMVFVWMSGIDLDQAMQEEISSPVAEVVETSGEIEGEVSEAKEFPDWDTEHDAWVSARMHGSWWEQMPVRAFYTLCLHLVGIPFLTFWLAGGLMMIGMALFQSGFFQGSWEPRRYRRLARWGLIGGGGACLIFSVLNQLGGWNWSGLFLHLNWAWWGTPLLALGYAAVLIPWSRTEGRGPVRWLRQGWAAMGRMAFSNYIGQTFLLSLIYYGHGLNLRGQVPFLTVLGIALTIAAVQMAISVLWLRRFRYGPLEWTWRSLTYGNLVPIRRDSDLIHSHTTEEA